MTSLLSRYSALTAAALLVGCVNELPAPAQLTIEVADKGEETKQIPWGSRDDPDIFGADLVYTAADLPSAGAAANTPWPASYWPVYEDSINYRWDGDSTLSPAAKYGQAFGVSGVEDAVSRYHGIDSQKHRTACTEDSQCDSELGETCSRRAGASDGYCIPTWFGLCHAWAPAAILHPEPQHPVTVNGVEFKVNDIKALATLVHDGVVNKFASRRCNDDDGKIEYDEYGRPKSGDCIDTNPGTFHLLVTNFLGMREQAFVYDRTWDDEVWNQPVSAYRITQKTEIDGPRANALVGVTTTGGDTQAFEAEVPEGEWKHFGAVTVEAGAAVTVHMSGSGDGDLYARFGAEPTAGDYDCRPYEGGSAERCELSVPAGATQLFVSVHGYAASDVNVNVTSGGEVPTRYLFNDDAVTFFDVRMEVDYITESSPHTDGPLVPRASSYTGTDRYHYVLEVDAGGRIVGGEWLDSSKQNHPDFLWLPVREGRQTFAGGTIRYADVMNILSQSIVAEDEGGEGAEKSVDESGSVARGQLVHLGPFPTAAAASLVATMTGSGDADLYVRRGAAPTLSSYDCRPYKSGSSESCTVEGAGDIYVGVHGYAASSEFALHIVYTEPGEGGGDDDGSDDDGSDDDGADDDDSEDDGGSAGGVAHLNESGNVASGEMKRFTLAVTAGQEVVVRTEAPNDVDLYVQFGHQPTTSDYAGIGYTASGNEQVVFTATSAGTLHIGVHGYQASSFTLTTAAE